MIAGERYLRDHCERCGAGGEILYSGQLAAAVCAGCYERETVALPVRLAFRLAWFLGACR